MVLEVIEDLNLLKTIYKQFSWIRPSCKRFEPNSLLCKSSFFAGYWFWIPCEEVLWNQYCILSDPFIQQISLFFRCYSLCISTEGEKIHPLHRKGRCFTSPPTGGPLVGPLWYTGGAGWPRKCFFNNTFPCKVRTVGVHGCVCKYIDPTILPTLAFWWNQWWGMITYIVLAK